MGLLRLKSVQIPRKVMLFVTEIECMYCKRTFDISRIHKSGYCRKCLDKLRKMYKDVKIPYVPVNEKTRKQWEKRRLKQQGLWNEKTDN